MASKDSDVILGIDLNLYPAYRQLSELKTTLTAQIKQLNAQLKIAPQVDKQAIQKAITGAENQLKATVNKMQNMAPLARANAQIIGEKNAEKERVQNFNDEIKRVQAMGKLNAQAAKDKQREELATSKAIEAEDKRRRTAIAKAEALATKQSAANAKELERIEREKAKVAMQVAAASEKYQAGAARRSYRNIELDAIGANLGAPVFSKNMQELTGRVYDTSYAMERFAGQLPRMRYALYDVSNTLALTGAAALGLSVATIAVSANFERNFANVTRTTGVAGSAVQSLKQDFIELGQSIPVSWQELTNIGMLAGQLGIASNQVAAFTETVAKFAATTDVSAEAAATALGRLDQLLAGNPNDSEKYDRLASSILAVGVNSVATESQIIAVAQNIASIGNLAGLSRDQVIGFSGALASVGIQPELARGLTARLFGEIGTAISHGSAQLETFAAVSGMTADEFKQSWGSDASATLIQFLKGINDEGSNAQATLASIGITSVRDVPNVLKLAQGYEEVSRLLGVSSKAYAENTELQVQYSKITEQLAEKFKLLAGSLQIFIAQMGGGAGALNEFLSFLNDIVKNLTKFVSTPVGQWTSGFILGLTALVGIVALLGSGLTRGVAALLAWKVSAIESAIAAGALAKGSTAATTSTWELTTALWSTVAASKAFKVAMMSTGIGIAFVASAALITEAYNAISNGMKSVQDRAKDSIGDFTQLTDALKLDTQVMNDAIENNGALASSFDTVTNATNGSTYAIGEHTKKILADLATTDPAVKQFSASVDAVNKAMQNIGGPQFDKQTFFKLAVTDGEAAIRMLQEYASSAREANLANLGIDAVATQNEISKLDAVMGEYINNIGTGAEVVDLFKGALQGATDEQVIATAIGEALGVQTAELTDSTTNYSDALNELRDSVDAAFSQTNAIAAFASDFSTLIQGIYEGGNSFSAFSDAGRNNLSNLQASIASTITAGKIMGIGATEAVAILFMQLQAQGINTANLLASLSGIAGVSVGAVKGYLNGTKQMGGNTQQLSTYLNALSANAKKAGGAIGGAGNSAGSAAKKVKTLSDYASELSSVFKRAFELRFGNTQSLDNITESFQSIAKATADARQELADLTADIQSLSADKALQEYFLTVAEAYGDTLKATEIRANLAKINADLAKKNTDLSDAQNDVNKTLTGNSAAAIKNRTTILDLVNKYQSYIQSLASSGMGQAELAATSQRLKSDFIAQATQLGYNSSELGVYAAAFDDVATIINRVPRDVTVNFNVNPALQALDEFIAKAEKAASAAGALGGGGGGGIDIPASTPVIKDLSPGPVGALISQASKDWFASINSGKTKTATTSAAKKTATAWNETFKQGATSNWLSSVFPPQKINTTSKTSATNAGTIWTSSLGMSTSASSMSGSIAKDQPLAIANAIGGGGKAGAGFSSSIGTSSNASAMSKSIFAQGVVSGNAGSSVGSGAGSKFSGGVSGSSDAGGMAGAIWNSRGQAYNMAAIVGANAGYTFNSAFGGALGAVSNVFSFVARAIGGRDGNPFTPFATGGYVSGPGSSTSDSIPARLSNGEYVVQASAVRAYGVNFFDNLNQMRTPQYYSGGAVGRQSQGVQMVALSPEDRALLRNAGGSGSVVLYADSKELARSVNDGNRQIVAQGGRP